MKRKTGKPFLLPGERRRNPGGSILMFAALALPCLALLALWGALRSAPDFSSGEKERFYRAVYLLQSLDAPLACRDLEAPRRVAHLDETESLLHHPDKIFVLRHLADELAALGDIPEAPLFEACARVALGEREQAAGLLMRHVIENEYKPQAYALLCETLQGLGDMRSLLLICLEWRQRDSSCREDRCRYAFSAMFGLGRYAEAEKFMREEGSCLGWRSEVYQARAALALDEPSAARLIARALELHPEDAPHIRRMWAMIRDKGKF